MSITCTCPVQTAIGDIGALSCPENVGQIQRIVFARRGNTFANVAAVIVAATWTSYFAAADATHHVVTPVIDNPVSEPGKEIAIGSGNEVPNGVPRVVGTEPTKFTITLRSFPASIIRALKALMCEGDNLMCYFVQEDGYIVGTTAPLGTIFTGFKVQSLLVTDKKIGGFNALDENTLSFSLKENWSDYLTIVNPLANFNPLEWV
jgi:hypothetical protein